MFSLCIHFDFADVNMNLIDLDSRSRHILGSSTIMLNIIRIEVRISKQCPRLNSRRTER